MSFSLQKRRHWMRIGWGKPEITVLVAPQPLLTQPSISFSKLLGREENLILTLGCWT